MGGRIVVDPRVPGCRSGTLAATPPSCAGRRRHLARAPGAAIAQRVRSPDCVVPLCWTHHRAYDTWRLELLPHLEPQWRAEVAHAVSHLGLIGAVRRLAPGRR
jgi:hypothetical protein